MVVAVVALVGAGLSATAQPEKVTVCHATGSGVKPFVEIHPSVNGAWAHYDKHERDAVAPFTYKGKEYSRLVGEGVQIVSDECVALQPEEPPEVEPGPPVEEEPPFTG
jgi:hypothetical protein